MSCNHARSRLPFLSLTSKFSGNCSRPATSHSKVTAQPDPLKRWRTTISAAPRLRKSQLVFSCKLRQWPSPTNAVRSIRLQLMLAEAGKATDIQLKAHQVIFLSDGSSSEYRKKVGKSADPTRLAATRSKMTRQRFSTFLKRRMIVS